MNSLTNTILSLLLGWLLTLLNVARDFISSDSSTVLFDFFRSNWKILFLVLCVGGFAMDKLVYLIRWRPQPIWIRRRIRRTGTVSKTPTPYATPRHRNDPSFFDQAADAADGNIFDQAAGYPDGNAFEQTSVYPGGNVFNQAPAYPVQNAYDQAPGYPGGNAFQPGMDYPDGDAAPTLQYQIPPQSREQGTRRAVLPYSTPRFAPEASLNDYQPPESVLHWDAASKGHTFAPAADPQQFAFGMEPSFGSAQSEPAYSFPQEAAPSFAPPQAPPDYYSAQTYPQPDAFAPPLYTDEPEPPAFEEANPLFRPFSDRKDQDFASPKSNRFGSVARKARSLLSAEDAYQNLSYQDIQPAVDVSKAFHSPVYPKQKPEGDA